MKSIFMLTGANLRKNKGQAISLLIFVLIATMFLDIGLVLIFNFENFFDQRAEELNAPHLSILQSNDVTTESQADWLSSHSEVMAIERQSVISGYGDYYMNGAKASGVLLFASAEAEQSMNPVSLIGESLPLDENHIYIPYLMKAAGGYELGENYSIALAGKEINFIIAGFTEEITFGALMNTFYRFYVSEETYEKLYEEMADNQYTLFSIRTTDKSLGMQVHLDYTKEFFYVEDAGEVSPDFIYSLDYTSQVKQARTFIPMILAALIIAFGIIILAISLVVIRFSIHNNIEQSMVNIGALKAIGYKSSQIIAAMVMQFGSVTMIGSILGIVLAQQWLSPLSKILESQSALIWNPGFDLRVAALSICLVLFAVLLVAFLSAKRIFRLYPLSALRGGIETHSFKKNRVPLDRCRGGLSLLMGMKHLLQNKTQSFMVVLIVSLMTFASVFCISLYYNLGVDMDAFGSMVAGEVPEALLDINSTDTENVLQNLHNRDDVRKAFEYQHITLMADDVMVTTIITKDFSQLEGNMLYAGRYPKYENEVAIGGKFAEVLGKNTGDMIVVKQGGQSKEFLITGMIQMMNGVGLNMAITHEALLTIQEDYSFDKVYVYLHNDIDVIEFLEDVKSEEGDSIVGTTDMKELLDAQLGGYGSIFAAVALAILLVTVVIIVLVLYMVIKTMLLRKNREFGIQKALGFTTIQLMNQIALYYTPLILFGVVFGGLLGYVGFNPFFSAVTKSMGVIKTEFPLPLNWTILTCLMLTVIAYGVSLLMASRIRKISPYALVSE